MTHRLRLMMDEDNANPGSMRPLKHLKPSDGIGAMKCGTTSLHYYLHQHPEIHMSRKKELNFFWRRATGARESSGTKRSSNLGTT